MELKIDKTDFQILNMLQQKGRMKRSVIAEHVGLTIPAVSERMRKMEESGVIRNYACIADARKLNLDMMAFVFIATESSKSYQIIIDQSEKEPEIQECHAITGGGSHLLKIRTVNTESLEKLLARIQSWKGVVNTTTDIVLSSPKETTALSLEHLKTKIENKK
ncbi:MAG: Lrp/AsnC family transcriptional regulator [Calditrichaeota bacterium]|nr:MAG: Lrp/AsnC family transcriptional regulator [Calditrichota bacterium]MBL1205934.1 Lrp/AsnC family transcriptional regulator [Calditrichota bacterium]NOG45762.1 Lrp/AsnC family transcriptional regulator [Calditrichota bacterium]